MSSKLNQHFVPQYAFGLFTCGQRYVHGISIRDGSMRKFASVRGQCSRHKFYGDDATEDELGRLETVHAAALRRLVEYAKGNGTPLSAEDDFNIRQAVLLQRYRTPRALAVYNNSMGPIHDLATQAFIEQLKRKRVKNKDKGIKAAAVKALEDGSIRFNGDLAAILHGIELAVTRVPFVADLKLVVLRNQTSDPFILSDAPSVAYNLFSWEYKKKGVLGFNCPGLMFFLPITTKIQVVLCDPRMYEFSSDEEPFADVTDPGDVAQLNALQLHIAQENVYFADVASEGYVARLYAAEAPKLKPLAPGHLIYPPGTILKDGRPNENEIQVAYEPQIHHRLRLKMLKYGMAPCEEAVMSGRTLEADKALRAYEPEPIHLPSGLSRTGRRRYRRSQNR